ncbi:hypothetical protein BO71DRAFT_397913 [Aspergillus ellipticus CBS 707.79]|uniref:GPI anchored protein n=1 Tax=Aspergillus ellipticus CBS 707.79 TaxID=1448320 RepID=A0A319EVS9_9EURO|nr:hypothetical protein BO71DRAFT_397913 [Aspergillus ellipticus CBS 707.79]
MKLNALLSTALCLAASQLVAADIDTTSTSTITNYITRTLVRVDEVTPTSSVASSTSLSTSSVPVIRTHAAPSIKLVASSSSVATPSSSAPASSSIVSVTKTTSVSSGPSGSTAASASPSGTLDSGAGSIDVKMPAALVAGSLALILGAI